MPDNVEIVDTELLSKVFETDKHDATVALLEDMAGRLAMKTKDQIHHELVRYGIAPRRRLPNKGEQQVQLLKQIFDNNGVDPFTGERWTIKDMQRLDRQLTDAIREGKLNPDDFADVQYHGEQPLLTPRVVSQTVREAIEPMLLITPLLQRINFSNGTTITFPAISSMMAGDLRIPERGEYPEGKTQLAGQITAKIGKHGIKVSMTEEMMRYSMWDVWSLNLRAAGRALARHKEQQAIDQVFGTGTVYFDNTTIPGRKTTGRDIQGNFNGTFTQDDLFDMWADLVQDGFVPDLIMMHPFAWPIFARDPVMRNLAYMNGGGAVISNAYSGAPGSAPQFDLGGLNQERRLDEPANLATTFHPVPTTFPFGSVRMLITPFVPFDRVNSSTTIYLADSRDLGILVVDEEVMTEEWNDPEHDVRSIKLRERYGITSSNEGRAVRQAKGIVVAKSFDFSMSTLQASVSLGTSEYVVS